MGPMSNGQPRQPGIAQRPTLRLQDSGKRRNLPSSSRGSFSMGDWPGKGRRGGGSVALGDTGGGERTAAGEDHTSFRACKSPKLRLAVRPLTSICFPPWKASAATAGNQPPWSLLAGWVRGGMNWVTVVAMLGSGPSLSTAASGKCR